MKLSKTYNLIFMFRKKLINTLKNLLKMYQPSVGSVILLLLLFGFLTEYFSTPNIIGSIKTTMAKYGLDNKVIFLNIFSDNHLVII